MQTGSYSYWTRVRMTLTEEERDLLIITLHALVIEWAIPENEPEALLLAKLRADREWD